MTEWTTWHVRHSSKIELVPGIDCWVWTAATGAGGYGRVSLRGSPEMAHRAAYEAASGPIPKGKVIRHKCGNRMCVRTSHLQIGTKADNARDTAEMFMTVTKLTASDVRGIRDDYNHGLPISDISRRYGIAFGSVYPIVCYKSFSWIDPDKKGQHKRRIVTRLNKSNVADIKTMLRKGDLSQRQIADIFGVRPSLISRINTGDRWANV